MVNSDHCVVMLTKLKALTPKVRPEKKTVFLLQHNNAKLHTSLRTVEYTGSLGCSVIQHSPYGLDLASSDFHLFRPMINELHGQHFPSNGTIIAAVKQWVASAGADFYEYGMQVLVNCWLKHIARDGDC